MKAIDCLVEARRLGDHYQLAINELIDSFRRAAPEQRRSALEVPIETMGPLEALIAGVVSSLCHEAGHPLPPWLASVRSPEPFFVLPATSFAMRVRLMLESPPPFRNRRVFVPESYMSRA